MHVLAGHPLPDSARKAGARRLTNHLGMPMKLAKLKFAMIPQGLGGRHSRPADELQSPYPPAQVGTAHEN
jgi:hypothetical protein